MESNTFIPAADIIRIQLIRLGIVHLLDVPNDLLVTDLKDEVSRNTRIPRECIHLIHHNRSIFLRDDYPLSTCGVQDNDTLYISELPNEGASSSDSNHPTAHQVEHPFTIQIHNRGTTDHALEAVLSIATGLAMNIEGHEQITADNIPVMDNLDSEANRLRKESQERGGGAHLAKVPNEQPLVDLLQATTSLLNNLARSVYAMRSRIRNQSRNPNSFEESFTDNVRLLRDQMSTTSDHLNNLSYVVGSVLTKPTEPEDEVNLPSHQPEEQDPRE